MQASLLAPLGLTLALLLFQMLDVGRNKLRSLPDEMSSLTNLKELQMSDNKLPEPPVSVLRHMTALHTIGLHDNGGGTGEGGPRFRIPSPLLPILHPGLVLLALGQRHGKSGPFKWDPMSLVHLGAAMAELAKRRPVPKLCFKG